MKKPRYTIIVYTPQELNHSSYIQTGFFELEKKGLVKVKIKLSLKKKKGTITVDDNNQLKYTDHLFPKASYYKLIDHVTNKSIRFACDLYDAANKFSLHALENCDFIFKRNYQSKYISLLPANYQQKIHKLGLTFGVHSTDHRGFVCFFISNFIGAFLFNFKLDRLIFSRLFKNYIKAKNHWKSIRKTRNINLFEDYSSLKKFNFILFQTRCFVNEDSLDTREIHQQRYKLIQFLKENYTENFKGGFIPSKLANKNYPNAISNINPEPSAYLSVLKKSSIVIYTRGLQDSPAWKIAEYCSQGKAILAEKISAELPTDLENEKHLLWFNSQEELKEKLDTLLSKSNITEELSKNARLYFEENIHPEKNILRILKVMECEI